jgi:hypothetical protein
MQVAQDQKSRKGVTKGSCGGFNLFSLQHNKPLRSLLVFVFVNGYL